MAPENTRQALLESTLSLIDEAGGCRGVTLRAVASRAGCAHTNAYNYFPSLDILFWEALAEAMARNTALRDEYLAEATPGSREAFAQLVLAQVTFATRHPGWYRLIWLEPMSQDAPPGLIPRMLQSWQVVREVIGPLLGEGVCEEELSRIIGILQSYVHGEICKQISMRDAASGGVTTPEHIQSAALRLLRLLAADTERTEGEVNIDG